MSSHASDFGTLIRLAPEAQSMEQIVSGWIAERIPLLWVPIIDVENFPGAEELAQEQARELDGGWLIVEPADFLILPNGIKGWLMPVDADDTDVACGRWQQEIFFLRISEKATGAPATYRSTASHEPRTS